MQMKVNLLKASTTYDDKAQLNQDAILDLKKQIYAKEIAVANHISTTSKRDLGLKPVNANFLNSSFLNDNPHFKEIKTAFLMYNNQVMNQPTDPIDLETYTVDALHIRPVLIDSLLKFMRLIMLTPDRDVQARMLAEVHAWYKDQVTKRQYKTHQQQEFDALLEKKLEQVRRAARPDPTNLPHEIIRTQKAAYLRNNRTAYQDVHAPDHQLKNYKRRILNFEDATDQFKMIKPSPKSRIKYERPPPLNFHKELESVNDPTSKQHNATSITTNANVSTEGIDPNAQHITIPEGNGPLENQQANDQDQGNVLQMDDFGLPEEEEQIEPEPQLEEQQGKLDPTIKNYIYPSSNFNSNVQTRMHQRILKMQHQIQAKNREDQAKYQSLKDWSKHRCRLQSEITRKIESTKQYAILQENKIFRAKTQTTEKFINLYKEEKTQKVAFEDTINAQKLEGAKRFGLRTINYQKTEPVYRQAGMSVFDRKRAKTQNRSLSEILDEHSRERERQHSLDQIQQIKQRFAKYKLPIELKKIGDGLMHPQQLTHTRLEEIGPTEVRLPSNPFMKVSKKKKKKKK